VSVFIGPVLGRIRATLARRGNTELTSLRQRLEAIDTHDSGRLTLYEFSKAMRDGGLSLSEPELRALFGAFDHNNSGYIPYHAVLAGVRGHMDGSREALVANAFKRMDNDGRGVVPVHMLRRTFRARDLAEVRSGKCSEGQVKNAFLDGFKKKDGSINCEAGVDLVSWPQFHQYYADISALTEDDNAFQLMMWNTWGASA
jgi:Ca2+-binding EF-hand superfamily protein